MISTVLQLLKEENEKTSQWNLFLSQQLDIGMKFQTLSINSRNLINSVFVENACENGGKNGNLNEMITTIEDEVEEEGEIVAQRLNEKEFKTLTASYFGAAAGLSKYVTATTLWQLMTHQIAVEKVNLLFVKHGQENEKNVIGMYTCLPIANGHIVTPTSLHVISSKHPWIVYNKNNKGATSDALIDDDGLLEAKSPYFKIHDEVPPDYMAQIQGQMEIYDRNYCHFVSMYKDHIRVFHVERSQHYFEWLFNRLHHFWKCVQDFKSNESISPPLLSSFSSSSSQQPPPSVNVSMIWDEELNFNFDCEFS